MNEFKTVKEIADLLNVSVQTIYKHVKKLDQSLINKDTGITLISLKGLEVIKENLNIQDEAQEAPGANQSLEVYDDYIETLKEQIRIKDQQIISLLDRLKENNAVNFKTALMTGEEPEEKDRKYTLKERLAILFKGSLKK